MIPIRDTVSSKNIPVVTYMIIGINAVVFLSQITMGPDLDPFIYIYGFVPAKFTVPQVSAYFSFTDALFSIISYMFLHGGLWHFLGNMWFLYIFGDNVEDHLGSLRFAAFYLLCGAASALLHFSLNHLSVIPTIGASGAVAGVMGAYFLLYPGARILTLIPIIIIPWFIEIPAFLFLGIWFIMQFYNATGSSGASGIAWWAHVGGFIAGMALLKLGSRVPRAGADAKLKTLTVRKRSPSLQIIRPRPSSQGLDLFGNIEITPLEAVSGTRKMVNIPWGFYKRIYSVNIPAGVEHGARLRLSGMGRDGMAASNGAMEGRGDMYLTVDIKKT
ncbi:MAG: rhomboid family intramembrane serine protease [Desulfamplus sp.]|nr:rhomboid family intramembrane serine protease [Desulfamplus sp.]